MTALANETLAFALGGQPATALDDFVQYDKVSDVRAFPVSRLRAQERLLVSDVGAPTAAVSQESQGTTVPQKMADVVRNQSAEYRRFRTLQQWEGVVTEIRDDVFEAELRDLNDSSKGSEFIELSLGEVSAPDKPLVRTGSVFYWIIGHETRSGGQILNVSEVRFKRTPRWSRADLEVARKRGKELFEQFASHDERSS